MVYRFLLLKTDGSMESEAYNAECLGPKTLGVEVTMAPLAVRCGLGNIDPQHWGEGTSSAIERAMVYPLPPDGTTFVTQRPDKDSMGAMAVMDLRAQGRERDINPHLVALISAMDGRGYTAENAEEMNSIYPNQKAVIDALNTIVRDEKNRWPHMVSRIILFETILTQEMPKEHVEELAAEKVPLGERFNPRQYRLERCGEKLRVAFMEAPGAGHDARHWLGDRFEVGVVHDPEHLTPAAGLHDRWSIIRKPGCFDRNRCEALLNAAEAQARRLSVEEVVGNGLSWGGNQNIISSAEGRFRQTMLDKEKILSIAIECAESDLYS